ncbi:hypothetical protein NK944_23870, partial [Salmonella enterica subsp. enterica serovar Typhimurium]
VRLKALSLQVEHHPCDRLSVQDCRFHTAQVRVLLLVTFSMEAVSDPGHTLQTGRGIAAYAYNLPTRLFRPVRNEVAELTGEVLVD